MTTATNRPTYAPERRPGDPTTHDLETSAYDLVAIHLTIGDLDTIAALIEAGAAALEYAPIHHTAVVEINSRRRAVELGRQVARAMGAELERTHARNQHRHQERTKREATEARRLERERRAGVQRLTDQEQTP